MRPVSPTFLEAVRETHVVATLVELRFPGTSEWIEVPVVGGDVTLDRTALVRRTSSIQIPWSLEAGYDLGVDLRTLPLGGYARLSRGVVYPTGYSELVSLGLLRVESVTWRTTDTLASIELADRMAQVRDEVFTTPYSAVPVGTPSIVRNGNLTDSSPVVTGLSQTSDLLVGMSVTGAGIPPLTVIQSIDSSSQVTLSQSVRGYGLKDCHGQPNYNLLNEIDGTDNLSVGMTVDLGKNTNGQAMAQPGTKIASIPSNIEVILDRNTANVTFWKPGSPPGYATATFGLPNPVSLTFGGGKRLADAALEIVAAVFGSTIEYRKLYDPAVTLADVFYASSRADALGNLATAAGAEVYFDANGAFVFGPIPKSGPSVFTIDAGATGVLVSTEEQLDRTSIYNGVLMQGQATALAAPIAALVVDSDPTSPTRWGGPFGKVARVEQSSAVQTVGQAQTAARALLDDRLGATRPLTIALAPNPALEPDDLVRVVFPDGRDELHVVDSIRIPLGAEGDQALVTHLADASVSRSVARRTRRTFYGRAAWREVQGARRARVAVTK